jgi:exopolysaccharide biosynthesis WecB/TagA/CpsF family protein
MKYLADTALLEEIFYPGMMLGGFSHAALDSGVSRKKANFAFVNADCLNKVWTDSDYRETLGRMAAVFADGIGVKLAAKMEGKKIVDNVNGTDLFPLLCQQAAVNQLKVFILGAKPGVAETCAEKMCARTPNLKIAGTQDGYFKEKDTHQIIDRINASGADILIVAFGAPLQEFWIDKHRNRLQVPVCIGVGGCIDFFAERISRAPTWVRNISMEWVWRLAQEPKRMWRRYIVGNPLFLYRAWKWAHLEIKMLFNRQQRVERQAVNYFATKAHSGLPRQFNTLFKLFAWKASIAGSRLIKRTMDITVATTMLLLLSPLFLILAVLIKSESKGPVLFSQMRIGLDGKPFKFWKFRSMRSDAEQTKKQLSASAMSDGVRFKIKKDPRITKVGAFIRKFSIDELPQLWNVLVGDMSLVGPRPALPQEVESYTLADKERLAVMPGITCIWQVSGRSDIPFKQQVKLDVQYRNSQSIVEDLKLLFLTVPAVILGKGAY